MSAMAFPAQVMWLFCDFDNYYGVNGIWVCHSCVLSQVTVSGYRIVKVPCVGNAAPH